MFRYIDSSDNTFLQKDPGYNRIVEKLNNFAEGLSSADKKLLLKMVNEVYYKYQKSILTYSESDTELMVSMLMALLVKQNKELSKFNKQANFKV